MDLSVIDRLSPRERECLRLVAELWTDKEIARQLDIGPASVKTMIGRAMRKLGTTSRQDAARMLLCHEPRPPVQWTSHQGGQSRDELAANQTGPDARFTQPTADTVREEHPAFAYDELPFGAFRGLGRIVAHGALHRILLIAAIALVIVLLAIAALPLADGAQRIANLIEPPKSNR